MLHWSLSAMSTGMFPGSRHDRAAWKPGDEQRAGLAGTQLSFVGVLLQIRGDWLEMSTSLGFPTWADSRSPCIFCKTDKQGMNCFVGFSPLSSVHELTRPADYKLACDTCELKRSLSQAQWTMVKNSLDYFKARDGPRGRALVADLPALGLRRHDRLEPDLHMQDTASFDSPAGFPLDVTFWRRSLETRARHRVPLFDDALGVSIDTICVDALHCLYLGPAMDWCCAVLWSLIDQNVFQVPGPLDQRVQVTVLRIKSDLWGFYKRWQAAHPGQDLTRLEDLTPGMLGSNTARKLATKAMETKQLMPFCLELLQAHGPAIGSTLVGQLRGIGEAMNAFIAVMAEQPFAMAPESIQAMYDALNRMFCLWQRTDLQPKPKLHLLMHMCDRAARLGNPRFYATWVDEGLNKVLASLGRQAHRSVWECRVLTYFEELQKRTTTKRRRRF